MKQSNLFSHFSNIKPIILSLIGLIGLVNSTIAREIMQFTFIGNAGGNHESVEGRKKYLSSQLSGSIARAFGQGKGKMALQSLQTTREFVVETCKRNVKIWLLSAALITLDATFILWTVMALLSLTVRGGLM